MKSNWMIWQVVCAVLTVVFGAISIVSALCNGVTPLTGISAICAGVAAAGIAFFLFLSHYSRAIPSAK